MAITLTEVNGIAAAIVSLKQTKRTFSMEEYERIQKLIYDHSNYKGFIVPPDNHDGRNSQKYLEEHEEIIKFTDNLAKWGAGWHQKDAGTWIDAGHETLLRYIDITFVVENCGYGTVADLDAHVMRFNNRIIRSSSRLAKYQELETSWWYQDKNLGLAEVADVIGLEFPEKFTDENGKVWVRAQNGYVPEGFDENGDYTRGNYPLHIPMNAICKINLFDLRHVYKRRNAYTHATQELRHDIESLADQVEAALPGCLGKLVRYDYAYDPEINEYVLAHIMDIKKTVASNPRTDSPISYE